MMSKDNKYLSRIVKDDDITIDSSCIINDSDGPICADVKNTSNSIDSVYRDIEIYNNFTQDENYNISANKRFSLRRTTYGAYDSDNMLEIPFVVITSIFSKRYYAGYYLDYINRTNKNDVNQTIALCDIGENTYLFSFNSGHELPDINANNTDSENFSILDNSDYMNPVGIKPEYEDIIITKYVKTSNYYDRKASSPLEHMSNKGYVLDSSVYKLTYKVSSSKCQSIGNTEGSGSSSYFYLKSLDFYFKLYSDENNVIDSVNDKALDTSICFYADSTNSIDQVGKEFNFSKDASIIKDENDGTLFKISLTNIGSNYFNIHVGTDGIEFKNMTYDMSYINSDSSNNDSKAQKMCVNVNIRSHLHAKIKYNSTSRPYSIKCVKINPTYEDNFSCSLVYELTPTLKQGEDIGELPSKYYSTINVIQPFFKLVNKKNNTYIAEINSAIDGSNSEIVKNDDNNRIINTFTNKFIVDSFIFSIDKKKQDVRFYTNFDDIKIDGVNVNTLFREMPLSYDDLSTHHKLSAAVKCYITGVNDIKDSSTLDDLNKNTTISIHNVMSYDNNENRGSSNLIFPDTVSFKCDNNDVIACALPLYDIKKYLSDNDDKGSSILKYKINDRTDIVKTVETKFLSKKESNAGIEVEVLDYTKEYDVVNYNDTNNDSSNYVVVPKITFTLNIDIDLCNKSNLANIVDFEIDVKYNNSISGKVLLSDIFNCIYLTANKTAINNEYEFNTNDRTVSDNTLYNDGNKFLINEIFNIGDKDNDSDEVFIIGDKNQTKQYAILVLDNETCKISLFSNDNIDNVNNRIGECLTDRYSLYATPIKRDNNGNIIYPKIINEL